MENQEQYIINRFLAENGLEENGYYLILKDIPVFRDGEIFIIKKDSIIRFDFVELEENGFAIKEITGNSGCKEYKADFTGNGRTFVAYVYECCEPNENICLNSCRKIEKMPESARSKIVLTNNFVVENLFLVPEEYVNELKTETKKFSGEIKKIDSDLNLQKRLFNVYLSATGIILLLAMWAKIFSLFQSKELSAFTFIGGLIITCIIIYKRYSFKRLEKRRNSLYKAHNKNFYEACHNFFESCRLLPEVNLKKQ